MLYLVSMRGLPLDTFQDPLCLTADPDPDDVGTRHGQKVLQGVGAFNLKSKKLCNPPTYLTITEQYDQWMLIINHKLHFYCIPENSTSV
jgi:hypothetical protein